MWEKIRKIGLGVLLILSVTAFNSGEARAGHHDDEDHDFDIHDLFGGLFDKGETCCTCFSDTCCLELKAQSCDAAGNLLDPAFLELFFDFLGISAGDFCDICDQCALNEFSPEENAQFLNTCDLCIFGSLIETHQCTPLPSPIVDEFLGGSGPSCGLGRPTQGSQGGFVWIGGLLMGAGLWVRRRLRTSRPKI